MAGAIFAAGVAVAWPEGVHTRIRGVPLTATASEARESFGRSDPGSYLFGGLILHRSARLAPEGLSLTTLWPPGMFVLNAAIIGVVGEQGPVLLVQSLLGVALWSVVLAWWVALLRRFMRQTAALAAAAVVLASSLFREFYLRAGIAYSESFATAFLIAALLAAAGIAWQPTAVRRLLLATLAGAALAVAAYFRNNFELAGLLLTIGAVLIAVPLALGAISPRRFPVRRLQAQAAALAVIVASFHCLTLPYRVFRHAWVGDWRWTSVADLVAGYNWVPDERLQLPPTTFIYAGGGNTACRVAPERCAEIARSELRSQNPYSGHAGGFTAVQFHRFTREALRRHLPRWLWLKLGLLPRYWFVTSTSITVPAGVEIPQNGLLLALLLGTFAGGLVLAARSGHLPLLALAVAVMMAIVGPPVILHYEARYFYPLKAVGLFLAPLVIGAARRRSC